MQITDFANNPQQNFDTKSPSAILELTTASLVFLLPIIIMFIISAK